MKLGEKNKIRIKKLLTFLLIFIVCIIGNIGFNIVINKSFNIKLDDIKTKIVDSHNIECQSNRCIALDDDSWIIVETKKDYILELDLKLDKKKYYEGRIYNSLELNGFNEIDTKAYTFVNGKNLVKISKDAKYIRLDIADKDDVFFINDLKLKSKFLYSITNINIINIFIISLFIYFIYLLFKKNKIVNCTP